MPPTYVSLYLPIMLVSLDIIVAMCCANVSPASFTTTSWWGSKPLFIRWNVTQPGFVRLGPSNLYVAFGLGGVCVALYQRSMTAGPPYVGISGVIVVGVMSVGVIIVVLVGVMPEGVLDEGVPVLFVAQPASAVAAQS